MEELTTVMEMWTPPDIEEYAADYEEDNNLENRGAHEYLWELVPQFPMAAFLKPSAETSINSAQDWIEWFKQENDWSDVDAPEGRWGYLAQEAEIDEPVIVVYNPEGEWHIWDGWHRVGSSFVAGRKSVPAVVGKPNFEEGY